MIELLQFVNYVGARSQRMHHMPRRPLFVSLAPMHDITWCMFALLARRPF